VTSDAHKAIQAHIVGGWPSDDPAKLARERLEQLGIATVLTDFRSEYVSSHCIAFDSRNGVLLKLVNILPIGMHE